MNLVTDLLHDPAVIRGWGIADWNRFLPLARSARLLGRSLKLFEQHGLVGVVPPRLIDQLHGALAQTRYVQGQALRELRHVARILAGEGIPLLALKGVAYLVADLPPAGWRNLSDIDLLVPERDIERAEQALKRAGWAPHGEFDSYDQHYYRDWMHEVPPLIHRNRETEVDLHHNLAPPVSRIRIDAAVLWADAVQVDAATGASVGTLSPVDMLLHNAIHLFMNDELRGGLRDVVDFRDLFEHFSRHDAAFEQALLERALALGCGRPLYYAVGSAQRLVGLRVSPQLVAGLRAHAPGSAVAGLMGWLIDQALAPGQLGGWRSTLASQLLFIRSHWVRMPPGMLVRHLLHKLRKKNGDAVSAADLPG